MTKRKPKLDLIVPYSIIYGEKPLENRMKYVENIPKDVLILEIAALNARLKPVDKISPNERLEFQYEQLAFFCGSDDSLYEEYVKLVYFAVENIEPGLKSYKIFTRQANLIALDEIIRQGPNLPPKGYKLSRDDRINILKYYFSINEFIAPIEIELDQDYSLEENHVSIQLFMDELSVYLNPIKSVERLIYWLKIIIPNPDYSKFIGSYFNPIGFDINTFLTVIFSLQVKRNMPHGLDIVYALNGSINPLKREVFEKLSCRTLATPIHCYDISEIRIGPLYKMKDGKFLILDYILLMEKCYEQFINDFFNTYLVHNGIEFSEYRGGFGNFFEHYVSQKFINIFERNRYYVKLYLDQLKINTTKGEIEVADVYIRDNKKVFIAQVKSNGLRNIQFSGKPKDLFTDSSGNDKEFLYKNFGLFQLIKSIEYLRDNSILFDPSFPSETKVDIYPALIINEKMFHTPLFSQLMETQFRKNLDESLFPFFNIRKLTVFHIEDLERIEDHFTEKRENFWKLLREHHKNNIITPPMTFTLNRLKVKSKVNFEPNFIEYLDFEEE